MNVIAWLRSPDPYYLVVTEDGSTVIGITRSGSILFWNSSNRRLESIFTREYDYFFSDKRYKKQHEILLSSDSSYALILDIKESKAMVDGGDEFYCKKWMR